MDFQIMIELLKQNKKYFHLLYNFAINYCTQYQLSILNIILNMIRNLCLSIKVCAFPKLNQIPNKTVCPLRKNSYLQFSTFQSIKFGVNPIKKTQILSLNNQEISQLSSITHYITSVQYLQKNDLQKSLEYLNYSLKDAKNKFPQSINLQMCLLNRISIVLKLLHRITQFVDTLEQIFFLCFSSKGPRSLDTQKNLDNYLLALTYHNMKKLEIIIEFINQSSEFQKIKSKKLQFYLALSQIINKNNFQIAIQKLNNLPEDTSSDKSFKYNNLAWLKFVCIKKKTQNQQTYNKNLKIEGQTIFKDYVRALLELQSKSSQSEMRRLNQAQMKKNMLFVGFLDNYLQEKTNVLRVSPIKLAHPQSHVVSMNMANLLFQCGRYEQAVIFMKQSLDTALDLNQIHRVGLCLVLLSKMNFKTGSSWQQILLNILENIQRYPKQIVKQCILTYSRFLYKEGRFVQAENYANQALSIQANIYLEGLILPEYDFSF